MDNAMQIRDRLEYPEVTLYERVRQTVGKYPQEPAEEFYGKKISYEKLLRRIDKTAQAFAARGIRTGDAVTICLPNIPQALDCFYALNKIGAVANMVHPLSAYREITFYLNVSGSGMIVTCDLFYETVLKAVGEADHPVTIVVVRIQDELSPILKTAYVLRKGLPYLKYPGRTGDLLWKDFLKSGAGTDVAVCPFDRQRTTVILYSGGTSGTPKGICLSDYNINACATQAREAIQEEMRNGLTMLSCMPLFHGFGLAINIHIVLMHGACCILMPTFNIKNYTQMLIQKKPSFIAGVPTIFEALLHMPDLEGVDLGFLRGMFCGGDSLSIELKQKIDAFLAQHNAAIQVREGYGLTECVTASCLTPKNEYRPGSIGLPFPDTVYCIVKPGSDEEVPRGEEGEIILTGPSVMLGYLNHPEETAQTLRVLADGRTWLYTGDLGYMDEEGFVYFRQRIKRLIVTNGYNVYPSWIENVIDGCEEVAYSCVIGVKDPRRMQRVRAYIVLKDGYVGDDACRERILTKLRESVAGYALPKEIIFREELPKTLVGKVAYRRLEEEANNETADRPE